MRNLLSSAAVLLAFAASVRAEDAPIIAHYRFESQDSVSKQLKFDRARIRNVSAGPLENPTSQTNTGSLEFDGETAIVFAEPRTSESQLNEGFTWEGFFLTPSSNTYETDGAIADRFISQYVDATGGSTRLAIGLSVLKKDGPPLLCIAFAGTSNRHNGQTPVIPDVWHHFAVVHEGSGTAGTLRWYLDYELAGEVTLDGKSSRTTLKPPGTARLTVGARLKQDGKVDRGFQGSLDEIRFSNRPLTVDEFLRVKEITYERPIIAEIFSAEEGKRVWDISGREPNQTVRLEGLSFAGLPQSFSPRGYPVERSGLQVIRATGKITLPAGRYEFLLRAQAETRLSVDGIPLIDARGAVSNHPLGRLPRQPRDYAAVFESDGAEHEFELAAAYAAGSNEELGDVVVCYSPEHKTDWRLLGHPAKLSLSTASWAGFRGRMLKHFQQLEPELRASAVERGNRAWAERHALARQAADSWMIPEPKQGGHPIDAFLAESSTGQASRIDDAAFLRRASLDIRGRIPTLAELEEFLDDHHSDKRTFVVDRFLESDEWADGWVGYWQDVLAENPSILKPTLNNSGPFRKWIYESFRRNLPMDRFATELILMEGGNEEGGTAGFAIASENDAPMAMKAHVVMKAFLAIDLECARCHDSPNSFLEQRDLFSLAAMLNERPLKLPATSIITVLPNGRKPVVTTSLKAGQMIPPDWTLDGVIPSDVVEDVLERTDGGRAQLAEIVTSPETPRFSDVIVNRVWRRYFGVGLVEPVDSWDDVEAASHPELLRYLSGWFVESGYNMKALARLIFTSRAYQQQISAGAVADKNAPAIGPVRRRLDAEQIVDSLHIAVGKDFGAEELTFDPNRTRGFLNLGTPHRAWQMTSMSNERDRPALSMPVNQSIVDVLKTFGWRASRPDPITVRDESPNPLQPLMLANSLLSSRIIRLTENSAITELCLEPIPVEELVDRMFLTVLSRRPDSEEQAAFAALLRPGFDSRLTGKPKPKIERQPRARVDWDKHLLAEASVELLEAERLVREGEPPTVRLTEDFRKRVEDALWCLINTPEFVFVP